MGPCCRSRSRLIGGGGDKEVAEKGRVSLQQNAVRMDLHVQDSETRIGLHAWDVEDDELVLWRRHRYVDAGGK